MTRLEREGSAPSTRFQREANAKAGLQVGHKLEGTASYRLRGLPLFFEPKVTLTIPKTKKKPLKCIKCSREFNHRASLEAHSRVHENEIECHICGGIFSSDYAVICHLQFAHKDKE
ncbi:hypothetical protein RUM43_008766 [Polyplax serrata]|uniref:C2H2-type domain-containing protein n=1 Tax=Polyplax serrata TaxID=468196 RepID=A0AAN8NN77_POLSC